MDFFSILQKMTELFIIVIIGYCGNKLGIFGKTAKQNMSKLIVNITLPATILSSVMNSENLPEPAVIGNLMIFAFLSYLIYFIVAKIASFLFRLKGSEKGTAEFAMMFGNVGFIGYPVTTAVFGPAVLFYTSVFNMPFNVFAYSYGIGLIRGGNENAENGFSLKKYLKKVFNPSMITSIIVIIMAVLGYRGPRIVANVAQTVGAITTPGALLIIGSSLAEMPIKEMFNNWKCYPIAIVKMVVMAFVVYVCFKPFTTDALLLGDATVISAMPVATAGTMLCIEYHGNEKFMSQLTFITTLASVILTPIVASLL